MNFFHRQQTLCIAALFALSIGCPALAQVSPTPNKVQVNAPYAQKLILAAKKHHMAIQKIGLHAVPPGQSASVVIANNLPVKIGNKDSVNDRAVENSGQPKVIRRNEGSFYDLYLPINDASNRPVGMITMEIPFKFASSEADALKMGEAICAEIQHKIPSKDALFVQ